MTTDLTASAPPRRRIRCRSCSGAYDPSTASVCDCVTEHRTLRCPSCGMCSCSADRLAMQRYFASADAAEVRRVREERQKEQRPSSAPAELKRPLVVVADDDFGIRLVVRRQLERSGFGVVAVADGAEAWEAIRRYRPEIALLDGLMPKADGREVIRRVKDDPTLRTRCVLMTSLYTSAAQKTEAFRLFGVDAHLAKPVKAEVLQETLRSLLSD